MLKMKSSFSRIIINSCHQLKNLLSCWSFFFYLKETIRGNHDNCKVFFEWISDIITFSLLDIFAHQVSCLDRFNKQTSGNFTESYILNVYQVCVHSQKFRKNCALYNAANNDAKMSCGENKHPIQRFPVNKLFFMSFPFNL